MNIKPELRLQESSGGELAPPDNGSQNLLAIAILVCEEHMELLETLLDESGVLTWTVLPAQQSRRQGFLQHVPRRHPDQCRLVLGFGGPSEIQGAIRAILRGRNSGQLCAECTVISWPAQQAFHGELHLDPVCDQVVEGEQALLQEVDGETLHFCSEACRKAFQDNPHLYRERRQTPYQIGRREIPVTV